MDQVANLAESRSTTYQLIGRNVLLFQQMEQLLKIILPRSTVSISANTDVQSLSERRHAAVEKCTLGNLVNRFIDEVYNPNEPIPTEDSGQLSITSAIRWKFPDSAKRDAQIQRLRDLVDGRNHLIHHIILNIDFDSPESWSSIQGDLEIQQRQILSEIKKLQQLINTMKKAAEKFSHLETQ